MLTVYLDTIDNKLNLSVPRINIDFVAS